MNIKFFTLVSISLMASLSVYPQDADDNATETAREKIKAARIGFITQRLSLSSEQAEKFWPVYNEFTQKRSDLRTQYRLAEKENNKNQKQQQTLIDLGLKLKQDELNLEKEYSDKLKNVISPQQILNLRQAERDFRTTIIKLLNDRRQFQK